MFHVAGCVTFQVTTHRDTQRGSSSRASCLQPWPQEPSTVTIECREALILQGPGFCVVSKPAGCSEPLEVCFLSGWSASMRTATPMPLEDLLCSGRGRLTAPKSFFPKESSLCRIILLRRRVVGSPSYRPAGWPGSIEWIPSSEANFFSRCALREVQASPALRC